MGLGERGRDRDTQRVLPLSLLPCSRDAPRVARSRAHTQRSLQAEVAKLKEELKADDRERRESEGERGREKEGSGQRESGRDIERRTQPSSRPAGLPASRLARQRHWDYDGQTTSTGAVLKHVVELYANIVHRGMV